jgi:hypothetical protein
MELRNTVSPPKNLTKDRTPKNKPADSVNPAHPYLYTLPREILIFDVENTADQTKVF